MFLASGKEVRGSDKHMLGNILILGNHPLSYNSEELSATDVIALLFLYPTSLLSPISPLLYLHGHFVS